MKELQISMSFYLTMKPNETEEQAMDRFYELMDSLEIQDNQESAFQVYGNKVEEI